MTAPAPGRWEATKLKRRQERAATGKNLVRRRPAPGAFAGVAVAAIDGRAIGSPAAIASASALSGPAVGSLSGKSILSVEVRPVLWLVLTPVLRGACVTTAVMIAVSAVFPSVFEAFH